MDIRGFFGGPKPSVQPKESSNTKRKHEELNATKPAGKSTVNAVDLTEEPPSSKNATVDLVAEENNPPSPKRQKASVVGDPVAPSADGAIPIVVDVPDTKLPSSAPTTNGVGP